MRDGRQTILRICAHGLAWVFAWALFETAAAVILRDRYLTDEKSLAYRHDELLGWFPEEGTRRVFKASQAVEVRHNDRGFREAAPVSSGNPRMAFFGDSFVWGFDVREEERFTDLLRSEFPEWEVLNRGVSGYGTDQEFLLLQREWDRDRPRIVFLVLSGNDRMDNSSDKAYGYFKPYFKREAGVLTLKGTPVPANAMFIYKNLPEPWRRSALVFVALKTAEKIRSLFRVPAIIDEDPTMDLVRAVRDFVESRGSDFILATVDRDKELERFCREEAVSCVDLSPVGSAFRFESYGSHWNPQGHQTVSRIFSEFIKLKAA